MRGLVLLTCFIAAISAVHEDPQQSLLCDVCHFTAKEIKMRVLGESGKEEAMGLAADVCLIISNYTPKWGEKCFKILNKHGIEAINYIFEHVPDVEAYCDEIIFEDEYICPHNDTAHNAFFQLKEGERCQACKDGLDMVKTLISSDDMKDMIHVIVNETCMAIGGDVASCEAVTDSVIDEILGNLLPMFKVDALCQFAGACPVPHWLEMHSSELGCLLCKDGFGILERIFASPELADIVNVAVNQTCQLIGYGEDSCLFVGKFVATKLLSTLKQVVEPATVCGKVGACPLTPAPKYIPDTLQDGEGCKACVDALKIVDSILKANETMDLVHVAVHETCMAIGGDVDTCTKIIEGVIDPILTRAIAMFDPAALCKQSGACPSLQLDSPEGGMFCNFCIDGILELQNIAKDKETNDMISELTSIACNAIKIPFCKAIIGVAVKDALQGITGLNANSTCSSLQACTKLHEENLGDACSTCTMVTNLVINGIVGNSEFKALVDAAISGICGVCPYKQCVPIMNAGFAQVVNMIKSFGGRGLCSLFGLC